MGRDCGGFKETLKRSKCVLLSLEGWGDYPRDRAIGLKDYTLIVGHGLCMHGESGIREQVLCMHGMLWNVVNT